LIDVRFALPLFPEALEQPSPFGADALLEPLQDFLLTCRSK
jgi:hypothetical protein